MKVMMVCLGNICRSPLAHGILQDRIDKNKLPWKVASSGTGSWHVGESPDKRSIEVAWENGIDISSQKAQQFKKKHFEEFDHIIAMDANNYNNILALAETETQKSKVSILLNYVYPRENRQVPDPYYNGGFQFVFELVEEGVEAFVKANCP